MTACRCGSGAHPRRCAVHPSARAEHVEELRVAQALDEPPVLDQVADEGGPYAPLFYVVAAVEAEIRRRLEPAPAPPIAPLVTHVPPLVTDGLRRSLQRVLEPLGFTHVRVERQEHAARVRLEGWCAECGRTHHVLMDERELAVTRDRLDAWWSLVGRLVRSAHRTADGSCAVCGAGSGWCTCPRS